MHTPRANPRGRLRSPSQLENAAATREIHVVPNARQDEALARDGVSREVPCSALKGETVPDSLPATPKSPRPDEFTGEFYQTLRES